MLPRQKLEGEGSEGVMVSGDGENREGSVVYLVMMARLGGTSDAPMNSARLWCLVFFNMDTCVQQ